MEFEWDEIKRLRNIQKHKLDFLDAIVVFDHDHLVKMARTTAGEERCLAVGKIAKCLCNAGLHIPWRNPADHFDAKGAGR